MPDGLGPNPSPWILKSLNLSSLYITQNVLTVVLQAKEGAEESPLEILPTSEACLLTAHVRVTAPCEVITLLFSDTNPSIFPTENARKLVTAIPEKLSGHINGPGC